MNPAVRQQLPLALPPSLRRWPPHIVSAAGPAGMRRPQPRTCVLIRGLVLAIVAAGHLGLGYALFRIAGAPPIAPQQPPIFASIILARSSAATAAPTPRQPAPKARPVQPRTLAAATPEPVPSQTSAPPPEAPAAAAPPAALAPLREHAEASVSAPRFDAAYLDNPAPAYPPMARRIGEEGVVRLRVWVSAAGTAERVELARSSGFARLDQSAEAAVRRWRFIPARHGDDNVPAWVTVPISFQLRG